MEIHRASEEAKARVANLVAREKAGSLSAEERSELEHYLQLEHIMRLAKARAQIHLSGTPPPLSGRSAAYRKPLKR